MKFLPCTFALPGQAACATGLSLHCIIAVAKDIEEAGGARSHITKLAVRAWVRVSAEQTTDRYSPAPARTQTSLMVRL